MNQINRYLIGYRFGPQFPPGVDQDLDEYLARLKGAREIRRSSIGRRVVEMTPEQRNTLAEQCKEAVIEEDVPLQLYGMPGLSGFRAPSGQIYTLTVNV